MFNLFCYPVAVGVQAGLGGASSVVNVALSATYLKWARENHLLNGLNHELRHQLVRADIVPVLNAPKRFRLQHHSNLIFFAPPSFSNSSKMQQTLDIQRDHEELIRQAMGRRARAGLLLFSTNRRGFKLSQATQQSYSALDVTRSTIPEDFKRSPKVHRCWEIRHRL